MHIHEVIKIGLILIGCAIGVCAQLVGNPFPKKFKRLEYIMQMTVLILILLIRLTEYEGAVLLIFLVSFLGFQIWRHYMYDRVTLKIVEKAFSDKEEADIFLAIQLLLYENRYESIKNGDIWLNELKKYHSKRNIVN